MAIAGATGTGKTSLARWILSTRAPARRLILDPLGDRPSSLAAAAAGRVFRSARELDQVLREHGPGGSWQYALVPPAGREPEYAAYLARLAEWAGEHGGPLWLVLEEAAAAARFGDCPPDLIRIAQRGRHVGVSIMALSQRPGSIHPDVRSELASGEAWFLRLVDWRDRQYLRERRGREFADRVARLAPLHALRVDPMADEAEPWAIEFSGRLPVARRL